ncbi:hypothetical protein C4Q31_14000 [Leptospira borgpetersenii serovar Ceylonica]|nr:hypothetical protein C4Q31_14000 [Leptospira borgpetersenii serovar Ceylonica]
MACGSRIIGWSSDHNFWKSCREKKKKIGFYNTFNKFKNRLQTGCFSLQLRQIVSILIFLNLLIRFHNIRQHNFRTLHA